MVIFTDILGQISVPSSSVKKGFLNLKDGIIDPSWWDLQAVPKCR